MIKKYIPILIACIALVISLYLFFSRPSIAFVRSQELVYGYLGMQEMHNKFEAQTQQWQANIDTLKSEYNIELNSYKEVANSLSASEKAKREVKLQNMQQELISYSDKLNEEAKKQEDEMLQGVLNQINTLVIEYGKANGYDFIIGTTNDGNLLYGKDSYDITEELLKNLNENYKR